MKLPLTATVVAVAALIFGGVATVIYRHTNRSSPVSAERLSKSDPAAVALTDVLTDRLPRPGIRLSHPHTPVTPEQDRGFALANPKPLHLPNPLHSDQEKNQSLSPGIYQTYPYSIILGVPERGMDDSILGSSATNGFNMPAIKPHVEAIPKT